jgi:hypothetical protein
MMAADLRSRGVEPNAVRPDPTPQNAAEAAAARLLGRLEADAARAERELGAPELDEVVRAAEGRLDDAERALWEERVARSPELARRAGALARFAAEAYPERARIVALPAARRRDAAPRVGWLGWAAAAAAALAVVLVGTGGPTEEAAEAFAPTSPPATELVFADGFEHGDPSSWSTVSPSG